MFWLAVTGEALGAVTPIETSLALTSGALVAHRIVSVFAWVGN